jgi:hypothetical protein
VGDNFAARARTEDSLVDLFHQDSDWMCESTIQAPNIYVLILANEDGCSLAASQLRKVIEVLRKYISNDHRDIDEVTAVDNALNAGRSSRRQVEQGFQHFLQKTKHGRRTMVRGRQDIVEQFCEALERRIDTTVLAGMEDVPLTRPLMYIGYALHFASRMEDHDHGEPSFLMQLVRSVSRYLYGGDFELQSYPICFLAEEYEVRLTELLLTQLANSFSWTGGGFNIHPPGMNNSSADLRDWEVGAAKDFWQQRRAFRSDQGFWHAARMTEQHDLEERTRAAEAPRAGLSGSLPPSQGHYGHQQDTVESLERLVQQEQVKSRNFRTHTQQAVKAQLQEATGLLDDAAEAGNDSSLIADLRRQTEVSMGWARGELGEASAATESRGEISSMMLSMFVRASMARMGNGRPECGFCRVNQQALETPLRTWYWTVCPGYPAGCPSDARSTHHCDRSTSSSTTWMELWREVQSLHA